MQSAPVIARIFELKAKGKKRPARERIAVFAAPTIGCVPLIKGRVGAPFSGTSRTASKWNNLTLAMRVLLCDGVVNPLYGLGVKFWRTAGKRFRLQRAPAAL
jgi:hypothetical protein